MELFALRWRNGNWISCILIEINRPLTCETARVRKRSHILLVIAKIASIILQRFLISIWFRPVFIFFYFLFKRFEIIPINHNVKKGLKPSSYKSKVSSTRNENFLCNSFITPQSSSKRDHESQFSPNSVNT